MQSILKYFPELTDQQQHQFDMLYDLYTDWNSKINVISRKDIENLYLHHVLHSLAIAKLLHFRDTTSILDVGTGGGFPGIPLAILFPECQFTLIDSIAKKIRVGQEVATAIGLTNITLKQLRVQEEKNKYDFVVSRAVMPLSDLVTLIRKNIASRQHNAMPNGLICLKGGELTHEIIPFKSIAESYEISTYFNEDYFKTKKVVYVPL